MHDPGAMGSIHSFIEQQGIGVARQQALTKHDRAVVEAAYQMLTDEQDRAGFTYSGFALTSLPHKPAAETVWRREGHNLTLVLDSGIDRSGKSVGLPYGSYARFILLFLQSEAVRSKSREVELGKSMRVWLGSMGLSIGGTTYKLTNEQARRISACRLTFYADRAGKEVMRHGGFVDGAISLTDDAAQGSLWQDRVLLNEQFYQSLLDHPVPVSEAGLRAIGARSLAIDIYIWLAYRLHALRADTTISWHALHGQFGAGVARLDNFRRYFIESLQVALAAYPAAKVTVEPSGITLVPSRPPIAPKILALG
jgi:hypothetical protein